MNTERVKNAEEYRKHGGGVFASGRKWALGAKKGIETALCRRITGTDWKKVTCKPVEQEENRENDRKNSKLNHEHQVKWEIPDNRSHTGNWAKRMRYQAYFLQINKMSSYLPDVLLVSIISHSPNNCFNLSISRAEF
jgi:hypothetical protein